MTKVFLSFFPSCLHQGEGAAVTVGTQRLGPHVCTVSCTNQLNKMRKRYSICLLQPLYSGLLSLYLSLFLPLHLPPSIFVLSLFLLLYCSPLHSLSSHHSHPMLPSLHHLPPLSSLSPGGSCGGVILWRGGPCTCVLLHSALVLPGHSLLAGYQGLASWGHEGQERREVIPCAERFGGFMEP